LNSLFSPNVATSIAARRAASAPQLSNILLLGAFTFLEQSTDASKAIERARALQLILHQMRAPDNHEARDPFRVPVDSEMIMRVRQRDRAVESTTGQPGKWAGAESSSSFLSGVAKHPSICLEALLIPGGSLKERLPLVRAWDGSDRLYLQAIRIGCQGLSSAAKTELFEALLEDALKAKATNENFALPPYYPTGSNEAYPLPSDPVPPTDARGKLIGVAWVLESVEALPALQRLASERPSDQVQRGVLMALSRFRDPKAADAVFAQLQSKGDSFQKAALLQLLGDRLKGDWKGIAHTARVGDAFKAALDDPDLRLTALRMLPDPMLNPKTGVRHSLIKFMSDPGQDIAVREAAFTTLFRARDSTAAAFLESEFKASLNAAQATPLAMLGVARMQSNNGRFTADSNKLLLIIRDTRYPADLRRRAVQTMAGDAQNARELLRVHNIKALPDDVLTEARYFLNSHADAGVRYEASKVLPLPKSTRTLDVRRLVSLKGNPEKGHDVFFAEGPQACGKCHRVQGVGQWVGPDLSAIGEKYPKSELFYHITQPSGAIAFGYQNWAVQTKDGRVLNGLIVDETPERIVLRTATGDRVPVTADEIETRKPLATSLMPDKLADPLKDEQIVDLLESLSSLRQPVVEAAEYLVLTPINPSKFGAGVKPVREGGAPWRKLTAGRDNVLDLAGLLKSRDETSGVAAYLTVESPIAQSAELVLSTPALATIAVNGVEVPAAVTKGGGYTVGIDLKAGANDVLLRLAPGGDKPTLTTAIISKRPVRLTAPSN